jgi:hypothetical protein
MGHFARECHSARVGKLILSEKTEEDTEEEADLALKIQIGPKRAREDTEVTVVTETEAVHQRQRKVVRV